MKIKETLINTLVDSMSMEDLQQYVANDMADFLYHCRESEIVKNEFLIKGNSINKIDILFKKIEKDNDWFTLSSWSRTIDKWS